MRDAANCFAYFSVIKEKVHRNVASFIAQGHLREGLYIKLGSFTYQLTPDRGGENVFSIV